VKTVVITGANRGIGFEFTRHYATRGYRVHACCRHPEKASDLAELAVQHAVQVHSLDVNDAQSVKGFAKALAETSIDLLINNAGVYGARVGLGELDYKVWQQVFLTNTLGPIRVTEALLSRLAVPGCKLVFITSKMGSIADNSSGGSYIYRSSKAALNAAVKSLAIDLADRQVIATLLHPGWVQTDMGGPNALISTQESVAQMTQTIDGLTMTHSGGFFNYDGKEIPW